MKYIGVPIQVEMRFSEPLDPCIHGSKNKRTTTSKDFKY